MPKKLLTIAFLLSLATPSLGVAQESSFFMSLDDVPLMEGLQELPEETLTFDKPEGRIIESYALLNDDVNAEGIFSYYKQVLPAFGWRMVGKRLFSRENEVLELAVIDGEGGCKLKVMIRPKT